MPPPGPPPTPADPADGPPESPAASPTASPVAGPTESDGGRDLALFGRLAVLYVAAGLLYRRVGGEIRPWGIRI